METKRQGIIVWFQHMKNVKQIKRYGHLIYVSRRMRYAVVYVNQADLKELVRKLDGLSFVSKVEVSYKPFVRTDFENSIPDKAKEYDYKMGI